MTKGETEKRKKLARIFSLLEKEFMCFLLLGDPASSKKVKRVDQIYANRSRK